MYEAKTNEKFTMAQKDAIDNTNLKIPRKKVGMALEQIRRISITLKINKNKNKIKPCI